MFGVNKKTREDISLWVHILMPSMITYIGAIAFFELSFDCHGKIEDFEKLNLHAKPDILYDAYGFLTILPYIFMYIVSIFFVRYASKKMIEYGGKNKGNIVLLISFIIATISSFVLIIASSPEKYGMCIGVDYFYIPRSIISSHVSNYPLMSSVFGVDAATVIFTAAVFASHLVFWSLGGAMFLVVPRSHDSAATEFVSMVDSRKKAIEELLVFASIYFVVCVFALGIWLRTPWDLLEGGERFYVYPRVLTVFYGLTVSCIILFAYWAACRYLHKAAETIRTAAGPSTTPPSTAGGTTGRELPIFVEVRRVAILLGPLWTAAIPLVLSELG